MPLHRPRLASATLTFLVSAVLLLGFNRTFWHKGLGYFAGHEAQLAALGAGLFILTFAVLTVFSVKYLIKPFFIVLLLVAAAASYYVDTFGILIDRDMIQNVALTTPSEARHLVTGAMVRHLAFFGLLPSLLVAGVAVVHRPFSVKLRHNTGTVLACVAAALVIVWWNYPSFASTFRRHPDLIGSFNPAAPVVSAAKYAYNRIGEAELGLITPLGTDAHQGAASQGAAKPWLTVLVVGETARAQSFGLNGTGLDTTPELARRDVVHFSDVSSCGTATAVSVPCMFSVLSRSGYARTKALASENLLDVLAHAGLGVSWYDNDTGSMQVADRSPYEFLPATDDPRFCRNGECHDEILVDRLRREIGSVTGNRVIVLHQIGSHGPAYAERYPAEFERFGPACHSGDFADCSREEIVAAYDNTIVYTDHILAEIVDLLAEHTELTTSMIYVSDHGESLGENGIYLHGAPYFLAPSTQTQVPMVAWFSQPYREATGLDMACLRAEADTPLSHDNLFHTVLGMADVATGVYDRSLDAFAACRRPPAGGPLADIGRTGP
ncbi:phosphoethanolamine transferase [Aureimonas pseudogalii]|uniref:Lipid A ethanolaminephosphotransferase n=1 Tax=Aureimonas pseudogalii TaxID=1744844 RepID=A0A7W6E9L5_9HYPH|nr:phosphoethanolamine--lipid A transferase [Aureimonas pseudogalii]MBB3996819.1 lipid A ethanolaminephosphotransferase [Aureimonas pseudogalii]